jgi:predicted RNase H-like nuclease (RuvC/YqgF family)
MTFSQVEQLREENEALMVELVGKKMALAELSESYARVKRDLHRREAKDRAYSTKMSRM